MPTSLLVLKIVSKTEVQLFHLLTPASAPSSSDCHVSFLEAALCSEHRLEPETDVVSGNERAVIVPPVNCLSLSR